MVNASLNWASIVGIVLAVCGGGLYFLRSFKPALARDYDVFFAAIGLLCGGILFFQGWRLDPILQFGQFLLVFQLITQQLVLIVIHKKNNTYSRNNSFKDIQSQLEGYLEMKNKNLITEDEYISKKKQILNI